MLDIFRGCHLGWALEVLGVLPEVLKPDSGNQQKVNTAFLGRPGPYSSVAFISGHDCGEQNSVIEP